MQWQMLFLSVPALVAFLVVAHVRNERQGILAAIFVAALEFTIDSFQVGFVEGFSLASLLSFGILGFLSIRRRNLLFFKLQSVFLEVVVAIVLAVYRFVYDVPLLAIILMRYVRIDEVLPPYQHGYFDVYAETMSASLPFLLLLHAGVLAYVAVKHSTAWWFHFRVFGLYGMWAMLFFAERLFRVSY